MQPHFKSEKKSKKYIKCGVGETSSSTLHFIIHCKSDLMSKQFLKTNIWIQIIVRKSAVALKLNVLSDILYLKGFKSMFYGAIINIKILYCGYSFKTSIHNSEF